MTNLIFVKLKGLKELFSLFFINKTKEEKKTSQKLSSNSCSLSSTNTPKQRHTHIEYVSDTNILRILAGYIPMKYRN